MKKIFIVLVACLSMQLVHAQNRINQNGKDVFLSGMNLAWVYFGYDLTNFSQERFAGALDSMQARGCNTMRWWLHIKGKVSPPFSMGAVSAITQNEIDNLKLGLDMAMSRNISIVLCLWSFDMLQTATDFTTSNVTRNRTLITDQNITNSYINNALIPMLSEVGIHPAVVCWEICNEPEGMSIENGWTTPTASRVSMLDIQKFINRLAGAIHKFNPKIKVSNGAQTFRTCSNAGTYTNYYSDTALVNAGKDPLGTLDFYMVHYYTSKDSITTSPFKNPASYWGLDKPIVIGEFAAKGPTGAINADSAFRYLYNNGYAGALGWAYTNHDGNGGVVEAEPGLMYLKNTYPNDIVVEYDNTAPFIKKELPSVAYPKGAKTVTDYVNLHDYYSDKEDGVNLKYIIKVNSDTNLVKITIADSLLSFKITDGKVGYARIRIDAIDSGNLVIRNYFTVGVYDTNSTSKAIFRKAWASSIENQLRLTEYATDSSTKTRWSSVYAENQWFVVELDKVYDVKQVNIYWEAAYPSSYQIQTSLDSVNWQTQFTTDVANGGKDTIRFTATPAKYVKMNGIKRATKWGMSMWSFDVYTDYSYVSIDELLSDSKNQWLIFPNPVSNILYFNNTNIELISVYNELGAKLLEVVNPNSYLDISQLESGKYFIVAKTTSDKIVSKSFIKQ